MGSSHQKDDIFDKLGFDYLEKLNLQQRIEYLHKIHVIVNESHYSSIDLVQTLQLKKGTIEALMTGQVSAFTLNGLRRIYTRLEGLSSVDMQLERNTERVPQFDTSQ